MHVHGRRVQTTHLRPAVYERLRSDFVGGYSRVRFRSKRYVNQQETPLLR
jgi:hypothetical protein